MWFDAGLWSFEVPTGLVIARLHDPAVSGHELECPGVPSESKRVPRFCVVQYGKKSWVEIGENTGGGGVGDTLVRV